MKKTKPYKTTPYKEGCSKQVEYETLDVYGSNSPHKYYASTTRCDYFDKKGNFHEGYVLRVKWVSLEEFFCEVIDREKSNPIPESVWERVEAIKRKAALARGSAGDD